MFIQLLNAGEDVLVFYNDNKASFQQFVEMMRNERDRQYQEDLQIMASSMGAVNTRVQDIKNIDSNEEPESKTMETIITEDSLQKESTMTATGSEYDDNNGHGALRYVNLFI